MVLRHGDVCTSVLEVGVGLCCVRLRRRQLVKMEDLGSAMQMGKKWLRDATKLNAKIGEVELADDIKCNAAESMIQESVERHLQLNPRRSQRTSNRAQIPL